MAWRVGQGSCDAELRVADGAARHPYHRMWTPGAVVLIAVAASFGIFVGGARAADVDFVTQVKPILENNCVRCHNPEKAKNKLRLDNKADAFKGGSDGVDIVPGDPAKSPLYTSTQLPDDDDKKMPAKGESLSKEQAETLRLWILQGAKWPDGVTLIARKIVVAETNDEAATIAEIYKKIIAQGNPDSSAEMKFYAETIPGTKVSFAMTPIPAGSFVMGSPASEAKRKADEGPQHPVTISPFWMEKCEVTWNEFELFMYPEMKKGTAGHVTTEIADAVTHPTKPYVEMSFGMGKDGFPAISMTQHAANTYCKWLSAKTGHFYRLPTEAEWEYACRAGTTTAYSFGDDASKLGDYAWFAGNSDGKYQKVGQKKPNAWGLFDMHGNVAEWTLDQYVAEGYGGAVAVTDPWVKATTPYPQVVRGGSWQDDPELLRSAARRGSDPSWKMQDPQLPKSIWYHTDAQFLGFRVIRPLKVPSAEELRKYWDSGVERE